MAVIQVNENTLDFIFDESVNYYEIYNIEQTEIFGLLSSNSKIYYYDENNNLVGIQETISGDTNLIFYTASAEEVGVQITFAVEDNDYVRFLKCSKDVMDDGLTAFKNIWYYVEIVNDQIVLNVIKGFRIENFTYAEGQTLETINTLVNPYIGTKTSFAKTYTLRVNGKLLNTINGKKIRNLIYNGTTYEIAEPVVANEYTLTITGYTGSLFGGNIPATIKPDETITIGITDSILDTSVVSATNCDAVIQQNGPFISYDLVISNATGNAVVELARGKGPF